MRSLYAATLVAACFLPNLAIAQDANAMAESAREARTVCFETAAAKAKAKKVSPDTFKLIIDGACQLESATARETYSAALNAATPAGLSIDPLPMKLRYLRTHDAQLADYKAKLISEYALGD